ncbi:MAG: hypothetical protein IT306_19710 [Chloroflexi bacterium]|nr:hypothetical protein [Chloroflexota bacterium]
MRDARPLAAGVGLFLVAAPLLACLRQASLLLVAGGLSAAAHAADRLLLPWLPVDPVYGGAGLAVLGGIDPRGLAVAGLPGQWLHALLPPLFGDPTLVADGAVASALVDPGITVLARLLAAILATSVLVALAGLAVGPARRPWLAVAGRLGQIWLLLDLAHETDLSIRDLEATGLPFALAALTPVDAHGQRILLTTALHDVPPAVLGLANALLAIGVCLLLAWVLMTLTRLRRASRKKPLTLRPAARPALLVGLALVLSLSPLRTFAEGEVAVAPMLLEESADPPAAPATPPSDATAPSDATPPSDATAPSNATPPSEAPSASVSGSRVTLDGGSYAYTLRVNGRPWIVKGMGYNPWYAALPTEERRALYRRDFALMRETGINTVEGWFQDQFDEVTLDEAHRQGLKVIMPFELNQDYDYADAATRARFRAEVTAWILRYRDHPAVLMWGPGNENLHRLIFPTAVQGQHDPAREQRADDFARFYVELIDLVHQLDPSHPVVYRDAEDLYLERFLAQLQAQPAARPWFVYGANVYTRRIADVIERWPTRGLDAPLLVSEFSPGGAGESDRPQMLGWYWATIRAHPERVLGGVVYTWATRGPEDLDRVFGLTDESGAPVDGSLAALRQLFTAPVSVRRQQREGLPPTR